MAEQLKKNVIQKLRGANMDIDLVSQFNIAWDRNPAHGMRLMVVMFTGAR